MPVFTTFAIAVFAAWGCVSEAEVLDPRLSEIAIAERCDGDGLLSDDEGMGVSLLQVGAKRLLNIVQPPKKDAITTANQTQLSLLVDMNRSEELIPRPSLVHERHGIHRALHLFQEATHRCHDQPGCKKESEVILTITITLLVLILCIFTAFFFFREDKEEQVTPLCPQMVVREGTLTFKLSLDRLTEKIDILNAEDPSKILAKVAMDWPDPFRPCASGIASTARLMNMAGMNMATVVARNCAVSGQALALCRHGCEIFGFVEPDTAMRYHVKHRTGVHLLTLVGDFASWNVDGVNPAGAVVFQARKEDGYIVGKVQQHVDAGLMICCAIAATVHRILQQPADPDSIDFGCDPMIDDSKKPPLALTGSEISQEEMNLSKEAPADGKQDAPDSSMSGQPSSSLAPDAEVHEY